MRRNYAFPELKFDIHCRLFVIPIGNQWSKIVIFATVHVKNRDGLLTLRPIPIRLKLAHATYGQQFP